MNAQKLKVILENHDKWLRYEGGERADLSDADLSGANLSDADLSYADLRSANLRRANLRSASTQGIYGLTIVSVDNIGTYGGKATYIPKYDVVFAGCWAGTLAKFLEKGKKMNEGDPKEFKNIEIAYEFFKNAIDTNADY